MTNDKKWLDIVERVSTLVCNCPEEKYLTDKERVGEKSTWGRAALKRNIKRDRRGQTEKDENEKFDESEKGFDGWPLLRRKEVVGLG